MTGVACRFPAGLCCGTLSQTVLAASYVPGDFSVHPRPTVKPGYACDSFCHVQVTGGWIIVHSLQYIQALISWNTPLPLFSGRCFLEVQVVEDVLKELAVPYLKIRVIGWTVLYFVEKVAVPRACYAASATWFWAPLLDRISKSNCCN